MVHWRLWELCITEFLSIQHPWLNIPPRLSIPTCSGFSLALLHVNKTLIQCILLFQTLLSVSCFLPTELPFPHTDLTGGTPNLSLLQLFVQQYARSHTRLCIRFSGITQGGKHRLIRSSSSSLVNTPLHSLLSYHCCDTVRCLLINSIQGMHKQMPLEAVIYLISRDNATKQVKLMFEDVLEHLNSEYESFGVSPVRLHAMSDIHVCIL